MYIGGVSHGGIATAPMEIEIATLADQIATVSTALFNRLDHVFRRQFHGFTGHPPGLPIIQLYGLG